MDDNLAKSLEQQEYHPVLIFGPQFSGKTTMLLSLIDYLKRRSMSALDVRAGQDVLPDSYERAAERKETARLLFHNELLEYQRNNTPLRTTLDYPFFVPVELHVKESPDDVNFTPLKLAFVEGRGEWYQLDASSPVRKTPPFREDIAEIIQSYERGISIIYVAPTISANIKYSDPLLQTQAAEIDMALSNVMDEFISLRPDKTRDHELFLLSKWDTRYGDDVITERFTGTMEDDVYAHISAPDGAYANSWNKFSGRPKRDSGKLALMPHFAGRIPYRDEPLRNADTLVEKVEPRRRFSNTPSLVKARDVFNRALSNWIFENATQSLRGQRQTLFPDVVLPKWAALRFYETALFYTVGKAPAKRSVAS